MSKLTHFIYWIVILGLAGLLWQAHNTNALLTSVESAEDLDPLTAKTSPAAKNLSAAPSANDPLGSAPEERIDTTSKRVEQLSSTVTPLPQEDIQQVANVVRPVTEDEATERMMAQLQRAKSYPERLQREGVDQDWNYQVSSDVERIFAEVTGLSEEHLGEVNCRMTLCEVQVSTRTNAPIDTMMRLQKALIEMPWYTEDYSTIFDATDKNGYYRIYLERESP